LRGDIDLAVEPALVVAVGELEALAPRAVVIDLADVTFAGASLVNFLIRVRNVIPGTASMRVLGATPIVERVLTVTAVDKFVGLHALQAIDGLGVKR
jgi:anti-anti-sigma factor